MILVTGASGNIGSELVGELVARRQPVRALVRDARGYTPPAGVECSALSDGTVEVVSADLNHPDTDAFASALTDVDGMFLLGGFADMPRILARASAAGVRHVVQLSSRSVVGGKPDNAVVAMHLAAEAAVRDSGIEWTVLRPSGFMSNALQWAGQLATGDVVRAPFADVPIAVIDPHDIASVAARVLIDELGEEVVDTVEVGTHDDHDDHRRGAHRGQAYSLSGPVALRPADQVAILAAALDRPLRFEAIPDETARAEMLRDTPAAYVDAFFRFFVGSDINGAEFDDTSIVAGVQKITGRPPRTFGQWVAAHIDRFH